MLKAAGAMAVFMVATVFLILNVVRLVTDWDPIQELEWTLALSLAAWAGIFTYVVEQMAIELTGASSVPSVNLPMLIPEYVPAESWTQPTAGPGDRLLEATMVDQDGHSGPIVVLVTPAGIVKGYSRALDGRALHLRWSEDDQMPPEPK